MKKETKRFETKEIKKSKYMNDDVKKVISFLVVLLIVALFIGLLFFINGKYVTKDEFQDSTTNAVSINTKLITLDDIFKSEKSEYYVLAYNAEDTKTSSIYSSLVSSTKSDIFYVNLDEAINKNHYDVAGEEKVNVKDIKDLMLTKPTLIKVKNKKIVSYTTNIDEIIKELSNKA